MSDLTGHFTKLSEDVKYEGHIGTVRVDSFRHADGEEVTREVVAHPGAVGILAVDDLHVWLVRQPREVVGEWTLEVPAGKLDHEGEAPEETAKRELAEEIGKAAESWQELTWFYTSPGFTDERVTIYLAEGLSDASAESDEEERIEIVPWPVSDLRGAIEQCRDAKSVIALQLLAARRRA
jgi:8-oxo-dGTP pyrophosphatase MutT (NUDIX family)